MTKIQGKHQPLLINGGFSRTVNLLWTMPGWTRTFCASQRCPAIQADKGPDALDPAGVQPAVE